MTMFKSKIINLANLAKAAGIPYSTLYNYKVGRSGIKKTISPAVKTKLANVLKKEISQFMEGMDFTIEINRKV